MQPAVTIDAELALWREIGVVQRTMERALEQRLQRDASISVADFDVLTTLCAAEGQRLRARDLGFTLGWEKSRLSHQVTRMTARGLVAREECPTDLRGTWIVITETGHAAAARGLEGHGDTLRSHFAALDADERERFESTIKKIRTSTEPSSCESALCDDESV